MVCVIWSKLTPTWFGNMWNGLRRLLSARTDTLREVALIASACQSRTFGRYPLLRIAMETSAGGLAQCESDADNVTPHDLTRNTAKESHDPVGELPDYRTSEASTSGVKGDFSSKYTSDKGYGYIERGYTTEVFKIELCNLPSRVGFGDMKKFLKSHKVNPAKIKKPDSMANSFFINLRSEEERQDALKILNGCVWKKREIVAKVAAPARDPLYQRKRKSNDSETQAKKARLAAMTPEERLTEAVTPLLGTPYDDQLSQKEAGVRMFLRSVVRDLLQREAHPGQWFVDHVESSGGLVCRLEPVRPSPIQTGYRNKCEFTVAMDTATSRPVVGFRLASYEEGDFSVVSAHSCVHIPDRMKEITMLFEQYLRTSSLLPFDSRSEKGHWRQLAVRCYTSGESMAVVSLHPQDLSAEELMAEKKKLTEYFSSEGSKVTPLSLYFQEMGRRRANWKATYEHLLGPKYVHENLFGLRFRISPDAFFQVNSPAAEVLYAHVGELCAPQNTSEGAELCAPQTRDLMLYDICCGTGTIGLCLAKSLCARKVIGVEMVEQAVEDARVNAQINGVANAEFICGKAEDVMPDMSHPQGSEVIGIVDPPRAGLHPKVVETIRKCAPLRRLVYVSCHLEGARKNLVNLCRRASNRIKGLPFRPVSATPIDLFPHTPHCEVVFLLERVTQEDLKPKDKRVEDSSPPGVKDLSPPIETDSDLKNRIY